MNDRREEGKSGSVIINVISVKECARVVEGVKERVSELAETLFIILLPNSYHYYYYFCNKVLAFSIFSLHAPLLYFFEYQKLK